MPVLGLLRHAKSDYPPGVVDHDRPLSARGRNDAPVAGTVIRERLGTPDLVLVSSARRAQQTWELAGAAWSIDLAERSEPRIYDASPQQILDVVREVPDTVKTLLVVGHVPGVSDLAMDLARPDQSEALTRLSQKFPTSGYAQFSVDGPWATCSADSSTLQSFDVPRG